MPIYSWRCSEGHTHDDFFRVGECPPFTRCPECGRKTQKIINTRNIGSCWPEGRRFENADGGKRVFKNYRELEKYCDQTGQAVVTTTPGKLKEKQEDRRHKILKGENPNRPKKKKLKVPEKVERAFRECSTVEKAVRALQENRV